MEQQIYGLAKYKANKFDYAIFYKILINLLGMKMFIVDQNSILNTAHKK